MTFILVVFLQSLKFPSVTETVSYEMIQTTQRQSLSIELENTELFFLGFPCLLVMCSTDRLVFGFFLSKFGFILKLVFPTKFWSALFKEDVVIL